MEKMVFHYQLEISTEVINDNPDNFLAALAIRKGKLRKGGRPDINQACRFLVREWTTGNLSFHTMPPEYDQTIEADKIQTEMSEELDLDAMFIGKSDEMGDDDGKAMTVLFKNNTGESQMNVKVEKAKTRKRKSGDDSMEDDDIQQEKRLDDLKHLAKPPAEHGRDLSNASSGKEMQKLMKKRRKQLKKSRKEMEGVGDDLADMMNDMN